ncbi:kinase-like domain-containing protein [Hypomontagnella monticulosa]|nr:kinase-like domain-containing protein [Hypomontagnella monticulosa]
MMHRGPPYKTLFRTGSNGGPNLLPTPNDVDRSSVEILCDESPGCCVVKIREKYVVKFGYHVKPIEADNMMYVAGSTTIPVPKVYAVYERQENRRTVTYIVMEYVPGETLRSAWPSLDEVRKLTIALRLRLYFNELRKLPSSGYFGNILGGPPLDDILPTAPAMHDFKRSFRTENELVNWILRMYSCAKGERADSKTQYYRRFLPTILRTDGISVFTHNDFHRKNVMVKPDGGLVILDWEYASWLPKYWEYSTATFANVGWSDDWHNWVRIIFDEYPNEAIWLSTLKTDMTR